MTGFPNATGFGALSPSKAIALVENQAPIRADDMVARCNDPKELRHQLRHAGWIALIENDKLRLRPPNIRDDLPTDPGFGRPRQNEIIS